MPDRHLGKFYLLGGALVLLIVAIVAGIAAVVLFHLLAPAPSLCGKAGANRVFAPAAEHASVLGFILECQAGGSRDLEVLGCDGCWDRGGVASFYEGRIWSP